MTPTNENTTQSPCSTGPALHLGNTDRQRYEASTAYGKWFVFDTWERRMVGGYPMTEQEARDDMVRRNREWLVWENRNRGMGAAK